MESFAVKLQTRAPWTRKPVWKLARCRTRNFPQIFSLQVCEMWTALEMRFVDFYSHESWIFARIGKVDFMRLQQTALCSQPYLVFWKIWWILEDNRWSLFFNEVAILRPEVEQKVKLYHGDLNEILRSFLISYFVDHLR